MKQKILRILRSDKADSMVSAVFVIPVILVVIVTGLDFSLYMTDRAQIQGIARDGARTVAIMGGNGTSTYATPLEKSYGKTITEACGPIKSTTPAYKALNSGSTAIECNIMDALNNSNGLVNVQVNSVKCTPSITKAIGDRVTCEIKWQYGGIPGSTLTMIRNGGINKNTIANESVTAASSESEVNLKGVPMVER